MSRKTVTRVAAGLGALGIVLVACGGSGDTPKDNPLAEAPMPAGHGIDTPAATLLRDLTQLFDSHVYLAGIAVEQAKLTGDPMSAQFMAAAGALDRNSQDLAAAIESAYGPEAAEQFLELWRSHIGMFVDYTVGGLTGDAALKQQAAAQLDQYREDFGAFMDSATGGALPAMAVAHALQMHVDALVATVDAVIAGDTRAFDLLYDAATLHMPHTATAFAGGIAESAGVPGEVESMESALQRDLTDMLVSHVYLAGIAVEQATLTGDPASPQFTAAAATLDRNSQDLAAAIESVYGPEAGAQFLELWRSHIGMFVDYTVGGLTGNAALQQQAAAQLDQYRQDFGAFMDSATGGELPAMTVADALGMHVESLTAAVDAVIAGDPAAFDLLYDAAHHMPETATAFAGGIIASSPNQFSA
jgi:hypothetical protein